MLGEGSLIGMGMKTRLMEDGDHVWCVIPILSCIWFACNSSGTELREYDQDQSHQKLYSYWSEAYYEWLAAGLSLFLHDTIRFRCFSLGRLATQPIMRARTQDIEVILTEMFVSFLSIVFHFP
jgi:hypothetical protein